MKKHLVLLLILPMILCFLTGCNPPNNTDDPIQTPTIDTDLGDDDDTFGDELEDTDIYEGYFDEQIIDTNILCVSGSNNAYVLNGSTLLFTNITEDTVYSISGQMYGNIIIDVSDEYKFELELVGFSLVSTKDAPIKIQDGDKITITAKKDTLNYIYDMREVVDSNDDETIKSSIHSSVDLQIGGKGTLFAFSKNNNGIHSKDDLEIKNLTLTVVCEDNALKGNDSVTITSGNITLISQRGDGIKTTNTDISSKGNQRGIVNISESNVTIYAACDGIDSAYDVIIDGENTILNIYTDKYSNYSKEVTITSETVYYIRFSNTSYNYSVKYYNSDDDYEWVNATYHSKVSGGFQSYYYYSFPKKTEYKKLKLFIYSSDMEQLQEENYAAQTDYLDLNTAYDTIAISYNSYSWTNYTTSVSQSRPGGMGFPGGMGEGNSEKGDHSTKGIKVANELVINGGNISIKSYDDSLHADNTATLENGNTPLGNITISGGNILLYSNDDGLHAENIVYINGGVTNIVHSYEGVEGSQVFISGGNLSIYAKDDGINSTSTSNTGVTLSGGYVYIYCTGDGIDSNSRTSYSGISFEGGDAVIISNSGMNSSIDTEQGYSYTAGSVVAIMPSGGMSREATNCKTFSQIGTSKNMSLTNGSTLTITGDMNLTITMPCSINALVIILNKNTNLSN